jgi:hypothetical protein
MRCSCFETLEGAFCSREPNLRLAKAIVAGASTEIPAMLNYNAKMTELVAKYGSCDMFAVAGGFDLTLPESGISVVVEPGHAFAETLLELSKPATLVLWDDSVNFLWLKNDGTLEAAKDSIDPPSGEGVYLGCVRCEAGNTVGASTLGRCELRAGNVVRRTLDPGIPGDQLPPDPSWFYTVTLGGVYLWDSERYWQVGS